MNPELHWSASERSSTVYLKMCLSIKARHEVLARGGSVIDANTAFEETGNMVQFNDRTHFPECVTDPQFNELLLEYFTYLCQIEKQLLSDVPFMVPQQEEVIKKLYNKLSLYHIMKFQGKLEYFDHVCYAK